MPKESVCDEAKRLTATDRQKSYGHPRDDFAKQALMMTGILRSKLKDGQVITAADVPLLMIAVKISRLTHAYKRDSIVDICGYARTAAMVEGDE